MRSGLSEGLLVFIESVDTIDTVVAEDFFLFSDESLELGEEDEFLVSSFGGVGEFSLEGFAHFSGVFKSISVSVFLGRSRGGDGLFGLDASVEFNDVSFKAADGNGQGVEDSVVTIDGGVVGGELMFFGFDEFSSFFVEVVEQVVEELGELFNSFF